MIFELPYRRMLILTEGRLGTFSSKTGTSVMRYRREHVAGVLDSAFVGQAIESILPGIRSVPIFGSVRESLAYKPDAILVGIAPTGGALPDRMRQHLIDGLRHGLSVVSGLHTMLKQDPELVELADQHGAKLHDIRDVGPLRRIAQGRARYTRAKRILTIGTDCNVGKMVTALELRRAAVEAGLDVAFVATGQTGIMIEGWGICIDHVISDFTAGAAEALVEHVADRQLCIIEGQGSLGHPAYSGVTLSLLHGTCPDAMVITCRPSRTLHNDWADCPIASIRQQIAVYEQMAALMHPSKVVAVAVNTVSMTEMEASEAIARISAETNLPAADPVRTGCEPLLKAVREHVSM